MRMEEKLGLRLASECERRGVECSEGSRWRAIGEAIDWPELAAAAMARRGGFGGSLRNHRLNERRQTGGWRSQRKPMKARSQPMITTSLMWSNRFQEARDGGSLLLLAQTRLRRQLELHQSTGGCRGGEGNIYSRGRRRGYKQ